MTTNIAQFNSPLAGSRRCACADVVLPYRPRWWTVPAAQLAAFTVFLVAGPIAGVDLAVRSGDGTTTVTAGLVLTASLVAALAGVGWMALLKRWSRRPARTWLLTAGGVLALSMLGPLGATNLAAGLALAAMHLTVAGLLALGSVPLSGE